MTELLKKTQYGAFDYLKLGLSFLVVAIHVNPFSSFGGLYGDVNIYFSRVFARLAVPLFFMISGFFFFSSRPHEGVNSEKVSYLLSYIKRILILWGSWFFILFPLTYYLNVIKGELSLYDLFDKFVYRGVYGVAWYFMASIHGMTLVSFLKKLRSDAALLLASAMLLFFCLASNTYFKVLPVPVSKMMLWYISSVFDPCFSFPLATVFICIGAWFTSHLQFVRRLPLFFVCGAILISVVLLGVEAFLLNEVYDVARRKVFDNNLYFSIVPISISIFILMLRQNIPANRYVRNLSTFVFLSHMIFVVTLGRIVFYTVGSCNSLLKYLIVIGCSVATGMCILYAERRFKWKWIRCFY